MSTRHDQDQAHQPDHVRKGSQKSITGRLTCIAIFNRKTNRNVEGWHRKYNFLIFVVGPVCRYHEIEYPS